ncbi:MAG: hypothetical protein Q4F97_06595 [Bacteroidales bacterium]|nr:hypothetical protein [Bacteroidales bacterium]
MAQQSKVTFSYYAEWMNSGSTGGVEGSRGDPESRQWFQYLGNAKFNMRSECISADCIKDGQQMITIFRSDSAAVFVIYPDEKRYLVMPFEKLSNTNKLIGLDWEVSRSSSKKFIDNNTFILGRQLNHYVFETESVDRYGNKESGGIEQWIDPSTNLVMKQSDGLGYIVKRVEMSRLVTGPQPDDKFAIPTGYKRVALGSGGLMEMLTGKPREENQQNLEKTEKAFKDVNDKIKNATEGKSEEEGLKNLLELLKETQNKKK